MSEEMDRRLREAGHRLPAPGDTDTAGARAQFVAAAPVPRRRRKPILAALAFAVLVGGAFGGGYAVAAGGNPPPKVIVKHVRERLDAGPGFLPAPGWTVAGDETRATATNGNVHLAATFAPASTGPIHLRQRVLPFQLPSGGAKRVLLAHVGAYAVHVVITFTGRRPTTAQLVAAREELGRLVVPSCPSTLPVQPRDVAVAIHRVMRWLPANYSGTPSDLVGATATAHRGSDMPRRAEAVADCGAIVASHSFEVDVTLPKVAKLSASLSQLTYFVAKTSKGWVVWERAR
jgi:hypothetical protein